MKDITKQFFGVALGVFLIVLAINTLFAPNDVAAGGVGGISIIAKKALNIEMSLTSLVLNASLLIIGFITLGKGFFLRTALGTLMFPLFIKIIPVVAITNDTILAVLFGSFLTALGIQILYNLDASSGGTSIPPLIMKKYFNLNTSIGLFVTDAFVVMLSLFVFGVEQFMYSVLVIVLTSVIMETISNGLMRRKSVMIISRHSDEIAQEIMSVIHRGATKIKAEGAFSKEERDVLMVVINDRDYNQLSKIVEAHDKDAFVIVQNVSNVLGQGFSYHSMVE
ncbi:MAG: YitT family protein [Erysipelotrichales bacterium]